MDDLNKNISLNQKGIYVLKNTKDIQLDHILPQDPSKEDKYYYYSTDNKTKLVLKQGHDFPNDLIVDSMNYEEFKIRVIHKLGNLKLIWGNDNASRGRKLISLPNYGDFKNYDQITERNDKIATKLYETDLFTITN